MRAELVRRGLSLRQKIIIGALGVGGLLAAVWLMQRRSDPRQSASVSSSPFQRVHVVEMKREPFEDVLETVGTIQASSAIDLQFETEGVIERFDFANGDRVMRGELIAQLDASDALLDLREAEIDLRKAEKLFAVGGITADELERARVLVQKARRAVARRTLAATASGVLADKAVSVGQFVTPTRVVARLLSVDNVMVSGWITERAIDSIALGQSVVARVASYSHVDFRGKIDRIDPEAKNHQFRIDARLQNPGGLLLPGLMARIRVVVHHVPNALIVPVDALVATGEGARDVFIVTADNKALRKPVKVGYLSTDRAVIEEGLEPGDLVIVRHAQGLGSGDPVVIDQRE